MIRNQVSLSAIKALIVHMGSLKEGRKSLILVSEGYTNIMPPQMRNADAQQPGLGNPAFGNPTAGLNDINEDRAACRRGHRPRIRICATSTTPRTRTTSRSTPSIRAGWPTFEFDINEGIGMPDRFDVPRSTMDTLRTLAENTDGRAIVNRNDVAVGMKQIMRDASAYYLIGYNSSQAPSDGKFHEIKVRVKRPGVQVRARKGYWALNRRRDRARAGAAEAAGAEAGRGGARVAMARPSRRAIVRTWIGTSRGENGKTRVTFVWEPLPKAPGERADGREEPARVSLTAVGADGSLVFRGRVPDAALASASPSSSSGAVDAGAAGSRASAPTSAAASRGPQRVVFEAPPGKVQLRLAVEGSSAQTLDSETRELAIPDMTAPQATIGTPMVLRARTLPELNKLKADADAVPSAVREFSRTERVMVRVPAYGPAGAPPLKIHILNRAGSAVAELPVTTSPKGDVQQCDVPLATLAPGEYVLEIKAGDQDGDPKELIGFRVTG